MANLSNMTNMLEAYRELLIQNGHIRAAMSITGVELFNNNGASVALHTLKDMQVDNDCTLTAVRDRLISDLSQCIRAAA